MPEAFPALIRSLPRFDGPFDAFRLAATGCDVLFATYSAGTEIPAHEHETENCGVIIQGELVLTIAGVEQRFEAGEWYHVPPRTVHAGRFEVPTTEIEFWFTAR